MELLKAYSKCIKIIQSLTSFSQVRATENYLENFRKVFGLGVQNDLVLTLKGALIKKQGKIFYK